MGMQQSRLVTFLVFCYVALPAKADVTAITGPAKPVLGNDLTCLANDDGTSPTVISWTWAVIAQHGNAVWPVATRVQGGTLIFPASAPADYAVACTVHYGGPNPPPDKTLPAIVITIAPPAKVKVVVGSGVTLPYFQANQIKMQILDGSGNICGANQSGMAQENKTDQIDWFNRRQPDSGWIPSSPAPTFMIGEGGRILDTQSCGISGWNLVLVGSTYTWNQLLRIRYTYPDGSITDYDVGTVHYIWTKVDANNWKDDASQ